MNRSIDEASDLRGSIGCGLNFWEIGVWLDAVNEYRRLVFLESMLRMIDGEFEGVRWGEGEWWGSGLLALDFCGGSNCMNFAGVAFWKIFNCRVDC